MEILEQGAEKVRTGQPRRSFDRPGRPALRGLSLASLLLLAQRATLPVLAQEKEHQAAQLPPEIRGAKIYHLPERASAGKPAENPVIYRNLGYESIDFERLTLGLSLSIKPVDRAATVRRIFFQNVQVGGVPVHIETFAEDFKLSKNEVVDLPAPLRCSVIFSDLDSLKPVKEIVEKDKIHISGQSFIEIKLSAFEKLALRTKQLVLPIQLNEEVPLQMFSGNPFLRTVVAKVLDTLSDPSTSAAIALAKEHLGKVAAFRTLLSRNRPSVYLLYCEYSLRNPATRVTETFSQLGTGFVVSAEGKLLTAKRVIQPWKFDPQIAFLTRRDHLELDPKTYKLTAWPAGSRVLLPDRHPDFQAALSTERQTLKVLKTAPDRMEQREYQDVDSGDHGTVSVHASGEGDLALIQLVGINFQSATLTEPKAGVNQDLPTALLGFPFGLSQEQASPQLIFVKATLEGTLISLDHQVNPGESGAPLLAADGKVLGLAGGSNECIPIEVAHSLIQ